MTTHRQISVSEWSKSQDPIIPRRDVSRSILSPTVIGLAGTLLLHGLALQTAILGGRTQRIPPREVRDLASSESKTTSAESLVFIEIPDPAKIDSALNDSLASVQATIVANPIVENIADLSPALDLTSLTSNEDKEAASTVTTGDGPERTRLLGIYSGQIQARVERIWTRPRTSVNEGGRPANPSNTVEYFHCQVQIVQDAMGAVQEVLLPNCNGSVAWQHSLVVAIQQASPLPAPPSPTVFSRTVTLNFSGYPYIAGASDEGYEKTAVETARVTLSAKTPEEISPEFSSFRSIRQERSQ